MRPIADGQEQKRRWTLQGNLKPRPTRPVCTTLLIFQTGANPMNSYSARRNTCGITSTSMPPPSDQPQRNAPFLAVVSENANGTQGGVATGSQEFGSGGGVGFCWPVTAAKRVRSARPAATPIMA